MTPQGLFQYYLDNFFRFPKDIKNDLIYCQRALRVHMKVHQMVIDVFQQQDPSTHLQKRKVLKDIEREIYSINAEQQYLFLRLRRSTETFFNMLRKNEIPLNAHLVNLKILTEVAPFVENPAIEIRPITVSKRMSEDQLIQKHFQLETIYDGDQSNVGEGLPPKDQGPVVYEVLDSDEEEQKRMDESKRRKKEFMCNEPEASLFKLTNGIVKERKVDNGRLSFQQPKPERLVNGKEKASKRIPDGPILNGKNLADKATMRELMKPGNPRPLTDEVTIELRPSKDVSISRLNLRQALKKAKAEAASRHHEAGHDSAVHPTKQKHVVNAIASVLAAEAIPAVHVIKKSETRTRASRSAAALAAAAASAEAASSVVPVVTSTKSKINPHELNSSSEDSNNDGTAMVSNGLSAWPMEPEDTRTMPEDYGQEMFLQIFQLYTPELLSQMQQRRSKRKRRCVQNNERVDFHYGRIEQSMAALEEAKKKKSKAFLLSPKIKRGRNQRTSPDNSAPSSRSTSRSPDDKRVCIQCLKGGGALDDCSKCKGAYHQTCHRREGGNVSYDLPPQLIDEVESKLCPICKRVHLEAMAKKARYAALSSTAQELEMKFAIESERRATLQQTSKLYKMQMHNLFSIVKSIKSEEAENILPA